jgi:hypothetical protein
MRIGLFLDNFDFVYKYQKPAMLLNSGIAGLVPSFAEGSKD